MVKLLLFLALLASVATADSNVVRSFHTSIASNGARTRYLRSNAPMVSMNYVEERAPSSLSFIQEAATSMINTLMKHRDYTDAIQNAANKRRKINVNNDASGTARSLSHLQIINWTKQRKTAEEVFELLNLHKAEGDLFDSLAFEDWIKFVKKRYAYGQKTEAIVSVLSRHFNGMAGLDEYLVARLNKNDYSRVGGRLGRILMEKRLFWQEDEPKSAEAAFTFLNLRDVNADLFDSQAFSVWCYFVHIEYLSEPVKMFDSMYSVLSHHCNSNDALDELLIARLNINDDSRLGWKFASGLLHGPLSRWAKENRKDHKDVFTRLNLQEANDKLFESSGLSLWADFVEASLPNEQEEVYPLMLSFLSTHYRDNDALMKMIDAQVEIYDGSFESSIAGGLLLASWLKKSQL